MEYLKLILGAMAVASISFTLSKAKVFEGIRYWVEAKSRWMGDLVHCPYCVSHWVAFALTLMLLPMPLPVGLWLNLFVSTFAIISLATVWVGIIAWAIMEKVEGG